MEIKKKAIKGEFDVLLVFMFDRLGRREDETPFVVQWFVQQGIEVWSTREGQQRFDTHVDKLLNYIRFWQASGESEKTSIRVRTKHLQMIEDGQYRGGYLPYGYKLVHKGRTNKKNQPVRDLVIDRHQDQARNDPLAGDFRPGADRQPDLPGLHADGRHLLAQAGTPADHR